MSSLDSRYGRTSRKGTVVGIVIAAAVLVGLALWWFFWANPVSTTGTALDVENIGFQILSDSQAQATVQVAVDPGTPVQCAVEAQDESFGVVGWKVVDLPASSQPIQTFTTTLLTTQASVSASAETCWVPTS